MEWVFLVPLAAIVVGPSAWVLNSWIRARHGYPPENLKDLSGGDRPGAARQIELLSSKNAGLKGQVGRLEERIAVLERIATDPAERTAREIERLR